MQGIIDALRRQDKTSRVELGGDGDEERDIDLKHAIRTFYISLLADSKGRVKFKPPLKRFC